MDIDNQYVTRTQDKRDTRDVQDIDIHDLATT